MSGVRGSDAIRRVAADVRVARDVVLPHEVYQGLTAGARPLQADAKGELAATMPSGYAPIVAAAFRAKITVLRHGRGATVTIVGRAKGKREDRDIPALNAGRLRHPVFGRRRSAWVNQPVPPGFFTRPTNRTIERINREISDAVRRTADAMTGR